MVILAILKQKSDGLAHILCYFDVELVMHSKQILETVPYLWICQSTYQDVKKTCYCFFVKIQKNATTTRYYLKCKFIALAYSCYQ